MDGGSTCCYNLHINTYQ